MYVTKRTKTAIISSGKFLIDRSFELSISEQIDYLRAMIDIIKLVKKQVIEEKKIHPVRPFIN